MTVDDNNSKFLAQFGDALYSPSTKETVTPSDAFQGKMVVMYFSAHWYVGFILCTVGQHAASNLNKLYIAHLFVLLVL